MELKDIQRTIQQIVSAISAVLKIEVEIADSRLLRIAGTGAIKPQIWKEMNNEDYVYRRCLETGEPVVIETPGFHDLCRKCVHVRNCRELGEVCCPIKTDDRTLGVIGLIAFTPEQRNRLFADLQANLTFLQKMAELIASKVMEHEFHLQQLMAQKKVSMLIDYMENGALVFNRQGECSYMNPAARRLLRMPMNEEPDRTVLAQIADIVLHSPEGNRSDEPVALKLGNQVKQMLVSMQTLSINPEMKEFVLFLNDPEQITHIASKLTEDSVKGFEHIIGNHASMKILKDLARKVANSPSCILIRGENGTGKEFFAQNIHRYSDRSGKPFLALNCAVLPEPLLERELFGRAPDRDGQDDGKPGMIECADGGMLFLDDIGDMPLSIQLKLLTFLEQKTIPGGQRKLDVKLIAATAKDLDQLVDQGLFRKELFYKLSVFPFYIPPLRERKEDILALANHFLQQHCAFTKKYIRAFDEEVKKILLSYHWKGNIRELSNAVEYAINVESATVVSKASLPDYLKNVVLDDASGYPMEASCNLRAVEKETIRRALLLVKEKGEPKDKAAELLGIGRATLFRKMQEYQL